jgi:hypothetical protein
MGIVGCFAQVLFVVVVVLLLPVEDFRVVQSSLKR